MNNNITGNAGANRLSGLAGDDLLDGDAGNDTLTGGIGVATLLGGSGDDVRLGGQSGDVLTGGAGADQFQFGGPTVGLDTISDFELGQGLIVLAAAALFGGGLTTGPLNAARLAGATATAAFGQLLYDPASGLLSWAAGGTGAGAAVGLAILATKPALTAADVIVIA